MNNIPDEDVTLPETKKIMYQSSKCKGCYYCIEVCKRNAILIANRANSKGYYPISIDQEKCTKCGACYIVCPDYVIEIL
jgi:2-oxoglutarate ferredoxin oxidoreductase subunit delta